MEKERPDEMEMAKKKDEKREKEKKNEINSFNFLIFLYKFYIKQNIENQSSNYIRIN
ncbi:hypothetical protein KY334_00535 [Candidatus Woesearchaeota archaeon]|nr:hypothetical protein [Candidatus Woesearchaeota archaeon]